MKTYVIQGPLPTNEDGDEPGSEEEAQRFLEKWTKPVGIQCVKFGMTVQAKVKPQETHSLPTF